MSIEEEDAKLTKLFQSKGVPPRVPVGSEFKDITNNKTYIYNGTDWVPKHTTVFYNGEAIPREDLVWLGDLAGYTVEPGGSMEQEGLFLRHNCGWEREIPDFNAMLGNITVLGRDNGHDCREYMNRKSG